MSEKLLLCTDLDRTLIPNGPRPESPGARDYFRKLCLQGNVTLAYVSGRHRSLVQQAISNYALPQPDYVVGDVGTTIYRIDAESHWHHLGEWHHRIGQDWAGRSHAEIRELFKDLNDLRLQEHSKQNDYKLSYYVSLPCDRQLLDRTMKMRLQALNVHASLVWSVDEPAGVGLLDVLPARATKFHAIEFLIRNLGFSLEETLFSGDSGNDLEVLASPVPAVLVANALPEVREEALRMARLSGNLESLYLAAGGFLQMNGNYSAGILEGVAHYHPQLVESLVAQLQARR
ncbi:MAG: HAD-IIB family hydrolase [Gammaproteobacteria bacterium]